MARTLTIEANQCINLNCLASHTVSPMNIHRILRVSFFLGLVFIGFSAIMDFALWLSWGSTVPSWTLSGLCAGFLLVLTVTYHMIVKGENKK